MSDFQITDRIIPDGEPQFGSSPELLTLFASLVKRRSWIYFLVGVTILATLVFCLFVPNQYTAKALILPSGGTPNSLGGLSEFAGLLGGSPLASADLGLEQSSFLYPDVLKSRLISEAVINKIYQYPQGGKNKNQNLFHYFKVKKMDGALKALTKIAVFEMDRKTGVITISATTTNRHLSAAMANEYINQLEGYNLDTRRSKAKDNEEFVSQRLKEVKAELRQAENNLEAFQLKNRNFNTATSPELAAELARLEREVEIKSRVFLTLTQQYEIARVETKKDVPIVQVLDYAKPPDEKSGPNRKLLVLASLLLSSLLGITIVLAVEFCRMRIRPDDYRQALNLGGEFKTDVIEAYTRIKRPLGWFERKKAKTLES